MPALRLRQLERALRALRITSPRRYPARLRHGPKRLEDYEEPRQIGRWAERRFDEFGIDMPQEAREMIDAAREGEFPEPVKDL